LIDGGNCLKNSHRAGFKRIARGKTLTHPCDPFIHCPIADGLRRPASCARRAGNCRSSGWSGVSIQE
jgi:hypothetical protein